ncbi:MAG TPA: hypothetical protein VL490_12345 [Mucilaginibacter sp.]|jgi:hypothetical protein|nr:hypothetical protein [Mucilaginibacter sp.]
MKKALLFLITVAQLTFAYSQQINYQKTFEEAKTLAAQKHKPIFIMLNAPALNAPKYKSGLDLQEVVDLYNKKFISYKVNLDDTASRTIRKIVNPYIFPTYIFLNENAQLVYKDDKNAIDAK